MSLYEQLINLLADVPVTTLSPILKVCFNLGTVAFFILLLRLIALLVNYPTNYSRWSWGAMLGLFGFGRAMTTMQLVFHKSLILSLEMSLVVGLVVGLIAYLLVPSVSGICSTIFKK